MLVSFLRYNSCDWQPLAIRGKVIDRVGSFKLLGLIISEDLKRAADCNVVNKKCNKRLYALRILKKCGVEVNKLVKVYCSLICSVTEYARSVFANTSKYPFQTLCNLHVQFKTSLDGNRMKHSNSALKNLVQVRKIKETKFSQILQQ